MEGGDTSNEQRNAQLSEGNNRFALELFEHVSGQDESSNVFFSPFSISVALAMTFAGARGRSADEMAKVLHFPSESVHQDFARYLTSLTASASEGVKLLLGNALWLQQNYPVEETFLKLTELYHAEANNLDFGQSEKARQTINQWVAQQTQDKIKDLIPSGVLDEQTKMVLTNAIYFKGTWQYTFPNDRTKKEDFFLLEDKEKLEVDMMHLPKQRLAYAQNEEKGYEVLQLPYKGNDVSMVIVLPSDHSKDRLSSLRQPNSLAEILSSLSSLQKSEVQVTLPKFSTTHSISLSKALSSLGMPHPFSDDADFSGMTSDPYVLFFCFHFSLSLSLSLSLSRFLSLLPSLPLLLYSVGLKIAEVLHKAFVEVNEEGTEAAAATAVVMRARCMVLKREIHFVADHPFLFFIYHQPLDSILFLGTMLDPRR
ncbi:SERPIN domain-containing protein [Balamuthia mandrillaris]